MSINLFILGEDKDIKNFESNFSLLSNKIVYDKETSNQRINQIIEFYEEHKFNSSLLLNYTIDYDFDDNLRHIDSISKLAQSHKNLKFLFQTLLRERFDSFRPSSSVLLEYFNTGKYVVDLLEDNGNFDCDKEKIIGINHIKYRNNLV